MKKQLLWTLAFFAFIAISLNAHGATVPSGYSYNTFAPGGYGAPCAIAVDTSTSEIFFASTSTQIWRINPDTSFTFLVSNPWSATGSTFSGDVTDIEVIQGGDLLLGGYQGTNGTVTRVNRTTSAPSLATYFSGGLASTGLAIDNSINTIYMTDGYGFSNSLWTSSSAASGTAASALHSVSASALSLEMMPGTSKLVYHDYLAKTLSWFDLTTSTTTSVSLATLGMGGTSNGNFAINPLTNDIYIPYSNTIVKIAPDGSSWSTFATGLSVAWYIDLAFGPSLLAGQSWEWSLYGTLGSAGQIFEIGGFGGSNPVPAPSVAWLLCVGLGGIFGIRKKFIKV